MRLENFSTPVLFIVFNRPDTTRRVFEKIRQIKPLRLYIAGDGPRGDKSDDAQKVQAVREYLMSNIDWQCEVKTLFREKNLGCKRSVSSAIDWLFENEEEGIILEDDCLPDASFFPFCAQLLEKYRQEERVMMITGDNFWNGDMPPYSYYFSKYCRIWGWASWRRAWKHYDVNMRLWPKTREKGSLAEKLDKKEYAYWSKYFDDIFSGEIDTWDAQLVFASFIQNMIAIAPAVNLISNIGFGPEAVHTKKESVSLSALKTKRMEFPLKHPTDMVPYERADAFSRKMFLRNGSLDFVKQCVPPSIRRFIKGLLSKG